jgi:uncharacterized membrane protein
LVAEFFGLLFSLVLLGIVLLPILTFIRLGRLGRELEELRTRVGELERQGQHTQYVATPTPAPATSTPFETSPAPTAPTPDTAVLGTPILSPPAPSAPNAPGAPSAPSIDLEDQIGGRGLLYAGVFILLLGISFFLKYAFDNAWVNETGRAVVGLITGMALIAGGLRLAASGLSTFGQA